MMLLRLSLPVLVTTLCLSACVSRYDPVPKIDPLSGECEDFAGFSRALAVQRDNGFTKKATMNIAAYSIASERHREILYQRYSMMLDLIYADRFVDPDSIRIMGSVVCEQQQRGRWREPQERDLPALAGFIKLCRKNTLSIPETEHCLVMNIEQYWRDYLVTPPTFNG